MRYVSLCPPEHVPSFNKDVGVVPGHHSRQRAASLRHHSGNQSLCYGAHITVIVWVAAFHWIFSPSASATNRRGRSVVPPLMTGTTLASLSMVTDLSLIQI